MIYALKIQYLIMDPRQAIKLQKRREKNRTSKIERVNVPLTGVLIRECWRFCRKKLIQNKRQKHSLLNAYINYKNTLNIPDKLFRVTTLGNLAPMERNQP
jgi:hypothetical protein